MSPGLPFRPSVRAVLGDGALRRVLALSIAGLVAACQHQEWDPQPVEASQSAIRFDHADFDPDLAEYEVGREPGTGTELHIARFFGAAAFAELAVLKTGPSYVVEERTTEIHVGRVFNGIELDWGEAGRVPSRMGYVGYRMFRLADQPFSCLGFSQTVGETADDRGRNKNLVIGYFCYDETRPPSAATAADLIGKVSIGR
jgi:hypothetical protein